MKMDVLGIVAIILLIFSLIFMFRPSIIFKLNKFCNKVIFTDAEFFSSPKVSGVLFIVFGIIIIFIGFYIKDVVKIIAL